MSTPSADVPPSVTGAGPSAVGAMPDAALPRASSPRRRLGVGAGIILVLAALAVTVVIGIVRAGTGAVPTATSASAAPAAAPGAAPTTSPNTGATNTAPNSTTDTGAASASASQRVYVDVVGEVKHPGMFVLSTGARVLDAISAAGGFAAKAQRDAVNLARPLTDGEQLVVPKVGAQSAASAGGAASSSGASGAAAGGVGGSAGTGTGTGTGTAGAAGASGGAPVAPGGRVNLNTATQEQLEALPRIGPALSQRILQWRQQNGRFTSVDDLLAVPGIGDKMLQSLRDLVTV